jgi:hypothetical protein
MLPIDFTEEQTKKIVAAAKRNSVSVSKWSL